MVAVIYSPGAGAGWYTRNSEHRGLLFDKDIAEAVLAGDREKAAEVAERKYPGGYWGGAQDLEVAWVAEGSRFEVTEYAGSESVRVFGPDIGIVA
jgi:hypothetical protein